MAINWPFADKVIRLGGVGGAQQIAAEDGLRQQATAQAILEDLRGQPGVILADEVGMGKTYVALGVVASVLLATRGEGRPVIVMMPPGLKSKWQLEWEQFKATCCANPKDLSSFREAYAHAPADFFRLLDTSKRRPHLIWMPTSCFSRGLSDPWIKLALIRLARARTRMDEETKRRLYKWATNLARLRSVRGLDAALIERLMNSSPERWRSILVDEGILAEDAADPVPDHLLKHQAEIEDWSSLVAVLQGEAIPWRRGRSAERRIAEARYDFNRACQDVYWQWIACAKWRASLLVLDEAHHAKNDSTQLASLFRRPDTQQLLAGDEDWAAPLLWGKFDRMLFLTATPFQLGHQELIRVLRTFAGARWKGRAAPEGTRQDFLAALTELEKRLNENRLAGRSLDRLWGLLTPAQVGIDGTEAELDLSRMVLDWWQRIKDGTTVPLELEQNIVRAVDECIRTKARAELDPEWPWVGLRRWVIRHNRSPLLPAKAGQPNVVRRLSRPGAAVQEEETGAGSVGSGLPIAADSALPFLLAARAQGELAAGSVRARAYFAEGLCSSYEAFHHTREGKGDVRDVDDDGQEKSGGVAEAEDSGESPIIPISWYEEHIHQLIPSRSASDEDRYRHPKLRPVVDRVVRLWASGEKVLVFCFYRETARALLAHVTRHLDHMMVALAAPKLGLDAKRDEAEVRDWLRRITRRLADRDSPFHQGITRVLQTPFDDSEFALLQDRRDDLVELLAAYVRTPSFIARYMPLEVPQVREALAEREARQEIVRAGVEAMCQALVERRDASARTDHDSTRRAISALRS
jgi:hypothetical protein